MAESPHASIHARQIGGIKRLRHLLPMLADLREVGCDRDAAGNRQLHFDEYVTLVLLYLMNPLIDSVRGLQKASAIDKVSEQLGVKRFSLGSFSESVRVFDPEKLKAVITQLAGELRPVHADPRLKTHLHHALTIADGTVLDAIARVSAAVWLPFKDGTVKHAWKLHVQFDFDHFIPADVELTDARNTGKSDEKNVLRKKLAKEHCYVMDRWFGQFTLFNAIHAKASSYVCRVKENSVFEVEEERPLSAEARQAGVIRDARVRMGLTCRPADRPDHPMRLIVIEAEPHEKRGGRRGKTAGPGNQGTILSSASKQPLILRNCHFAGIIYRGHLLPWTRMRGSRIEDTDIGALEIRRVIFDNCTFTRVRFGINGGMFIKGCHFVGCDFDFSELNNINLLSTTFENCHFNNSKIVGAQVSDCQFNQVIFRSRFESGNLVRCQFSKSELQLAEFVNAGMVNVPLDGAEWPDRPDNFILMPEAYVMACDALRARLTGKVFLKYQKIAQIRSKSKSPKCIDVSYFESIDDYERAIVMEELYKLRWKSMKS